MKRPPRRRSAAAVLVLAVSTAMAGTAAAAAPPAAASACAPDPADAAVALAAVSDDLDVTLADGRTLRLAGIDAPRATPAAPDLPARARQALEAWSAGAGGGVVAVRTLAPTPDRWGRIPALLVRIGGSGRPGSAAEALVGAGLARVKPEAAAHACVLALLAAEAEARAARRGLWADARYAVLAAADAEGLARQAGGLALVEGILHLHEGRGALYLALGRDRRGFVAIVSRRDAQRFRTAGLDLADYDGTPVRLRGDLDARFGPRMRLAEPDAVESLEPGALAEEPDAKHWTARARAR